MISVIPKKVFIFTTGVPEYFQICPDMIQICSNNFQAGMRLPPPPPPPPPPTPPIPPKNFFFFLGKLFEEEDR